MTRFLIVGLLSVAVAAGCANNGVRNPFERSSQPPVAGYDNEYSDGAVAPPGLALSSEQRFRDIPLPVGLEEDKKQTYVYESADLQIGRMVYKTRASLNELAQFYITECPVANWRLDRTVEVPGEGTELTFLKPDRRLDVRIRDLGQLRGRELILHLTPVNQ